MGRRKIKSLSDCQRLLAWTLNELIADNIKGSKASKIGYLVNILKGVIVDGDLEKRVMRLEIISKREPQSINHDDDFNHLANKGSHNDES